MSNDRTEQHNGTGGTVQVEGARLVDTVRQDAASLARAAEISRREIEPPASVPGYDITRRLGEGAYGSVWLATERNTGKQVAIKFYSHRRGLDWSLLNREVEKLAVLYTSRNIVGLLDVGWDSDPPYYVMEHLDNGSLAALLHEEPLPVHETVRITRSVLQALVHAHGAGILHCDLKPANVLLDADYEPRLCDFGQSRLSDEQNPALGTMFYMAPEQADLGAVPDARWDVYALGALLYHMLTGEAPYRTPENERRIREAGNLDDKLAEYRRILKHSPRPTAHRSVRGVDRRLADIVDRCLQFNPDKRFSNAQAVLDAIEERDRQRARRPLMVLGVVFPIILLLLMSPVAKQAGTKAVGTATQSLTDRAMESNALSANITAHNIRLDLQLRTDELVRITQQMDLAAALDENERILREHDTGVWEDLSDAQRIELAKTTWAERRKLFKTLEDLKDDSDRGRANLGMSTDRSWFITDSAGYQRWRYPVDIERTLDKRYNYRDYYHAHRKEFPKDDTPDNLQPITEPHVSLAFRSQSTKKFMVAISVPIREKTENGEPGRVVGILARTMDLGDMLADYSAGLQLEGRSVALVENKDGKLLDHPWMKKHNLNKLERFDRNLTSLTLPEALRRRIAALKSPSARNRNTGGNALQREGNPAHNAGDGPPLSNDDRAKVNDKHNSSALPTTSSDNRNRRGPIRESLRIPDYRDPVGRIPLPSAQPYRGEWLAAGAPVGGDTGWTVLVQERKSLAMEPIEKMEQGLVNSGLWALGLFIALIVAVWAFVVWKINDQPLRPVSARNGSTRPEGPTETTTAGNRE